jgi:hypothetical protein
MPIPKNFSEEFVIYYSREDKAWIAHGLNTDQLGVGADPIAALRDGIKAVSQVISLCKRDPTASPAATSMVAISPPPRSRCGNTTASRGRPEPPECW